jgi:hypothetical protein
MKTVHAMQLMTDSGTARTISAGSDPKYNRSVSKIESGEQAVFDFQVLYFRRVFKADIDDL